MDDAELLKAWQAGKSESGRVLIERYYEPIHRFFFAKVPGGAYEELTQETFELLVRRRGGYRGEGTVRSYLYGIARFVLIAHLRRNRRHRERFVPAEHSAVDPAFEGGSMVFAALEHERVVAAALRSLPLDDQITIELKVWEGLSQDELAALFEVPRSTMGSRLMRARARLRDAVERHLADPALRANLDEGLSTALRSIHGKIKDHLEQARLDHAEAEQ